MTSIFVDLKDDTLEQKEIFDEFLSVVDLDDKEIDIPFYVLKCWLTNKALDTINFKYFHNEFISLYQKLTSNSIVHITETYNDLIIISINYKGLIINITELSSDTASLVYYQNYEFNFHSIQNRVLETGEGLL